jgi:hypothetical protein
MQDFNNPIISMKNRIICLLVTLPFFLLVSCTTYLIPIESFKKQISGIDSTKLIPVTVKGPIGEKYNYLANPISEIYCVDKKGNSFMLKNSPSIEIRFTYGVQNKKAIYYFDRININNNSVIGVQSRFISAIRKTIALDSINKIEIQDGRKKFHYVVDN